MKQSMRFRKIIILLFIVAVILVAASPVFGQSIIDDARKTVVLVFAQDANGVLVGWGSGFVIGVTEPVQYVATNWHVVNPASYNRRNVDIFLFISSDDYVPVIVYHTLPETDIALLQIDPTHLLYGYDPVPLATRDTVFTGDDVYALGFPSGNITDFFTTYYTDVTVTKGIVSKSTTWNGRGVYQTDAAVNYGNSGGPLINDQGHIIGINTFTMLDTDGINGAIQIDYLIEVLTRRGIVFKSAADQLVQTEPQVDDEEEEDGEEVDAGEEEDEDEDEDDYLLIGGIGIGALVLIGLIIALLMSGKKKKTPARPAAPVSSSGPVFPPVPPRPVVPPSIDSGAPTMPRTGPAASATMAKQGPGVTQARVSKPRPVVRGVSGAFTGQIFELVNNSLIIGRDPRMAQVVYPNDSEEISRSHCKLTYDQTTDKFTLEDSSSNGTFLASNQKLETGKPYTLNLGDRFYLVDSKEMFEVKVEK